MSHKGQTRRLGRGDAVIHVRFAPEATELLRRHEMTRCAISDVYAMQQGSRLFDHFVSAAEQLCWHFEPQRLRRLQIDHQLELDRGLDGEITGFFALQDAIGIRGGCRKLSFWSFP
jgi:hypothetical protein